MAVLYLNMIGRFGNQMFQYANAKAYCILNGHTLSTQDWVGRDIFDLSDDASHYSGAVPCFHGYCQDQKSLIYSKSMLSNIFKWKTEIKERLESALPKDDEFIGHLRAGDYFGYGYPVVSVKSYYQACGQFGLNASALRFVQESEPFDIDGFNGRMGCIPDFYRMVRAPVLLRANSSFSWWAGALGNGRVFSPIVNGLEGGREHDCSFVEGNWPQLSDRGDATDLHLEP